MSLHSSRYKNAFILAVLGFVTTGISGCASVKSMICDCGEESQQPCSECPHCGECSVSAGCESPSCVVEGAISTQSMPYPPPAAEMHIPPSGYQSEAERWAPRTAYLPPATTESPQNCDLQLKAAKAEFDAKLEALEARFEAEKQSKLALNQSLKSVNGEVSRLSKELDYWRDEVRQIERTTEMQHRSDMAALQSISEMIDTIEPSSPRPPSRQ